MRKFAVVLALAALPLLAQVPLPAAPTKYVTDAAGVLDDERERALDERLAQFERDTTHQVIVYVDRRIPAGTTIEELATEALRTWRVGQAEQNNGVILFLFIDDRESRIEVGYGLEHVLTHEASKGILVGLRPALRAGDYTTAVEEGVNAIFTMIVDPVARRAAVVQPPPSVDSRDDQVLGLGVLFVFAALAFGIVLAVVYNRWQDDWDVDVTWIPPHHHEHDDDDDDWTSSSQPLSSSSSSSSAPSFRGGGGSGGGGGASDKW